MEIGKLSNDVLKEIILDKFKIKRSDVIVGPGIGEDCAVVDFNDEVCVLTMDPITAATSNVGALAININLNDIASSGAEPVGVMITILAPPNTSLDDLENLIDQIADECSKYNIDVLGGHTEITDAVNRIIVSAAAIGRTKRDKFIRTGGANLGDDVVVTGYAGLEGTSIIANDYEKYLKGKLSDDKIIKAKNLLKEISVLSTSKIAVEFGVTAMHDVTEGGVLGALFEIAEASNKGIYVIKENIPVLDETKEICNLFEIDPYKLISSGSMIITCKDGVSLCNKLKQHGIKAEVVGKIIERDKIVECNGEIYKLEPPQSDEIYRISFKED